MDAVAVVREGEGPEVLLVHGGASPETTWGALAPLAARWTLARVRRRGYPPSPPPPDGRQDFDVDAADVAPLLGARPHVVAHSYGVLGTLIAATREPERVRSLTLIEPPLFYLVPDDDEVARLERTGNAVLTHGLETDAATLREFLRIAGAPELDDGPLPDDVARGVRRAHGGRLPSEARPALELIRDAGIPALVASGGRSRPGADLRRARHGPRCPTAGRARRWALRRRGARFRRPARRVPRLRGVSTPSHDGHKYVKPLAPGRKLHPVSRTGTNGNGRRPRERSIAVVGGGFGGVGAAVMLRRAGYQDVTVFERAERVGGVWHHNTYPGAACDVPSHLYEFSFAPNPRWSRRYAPQAEIQAYLEDVARRHGVFERIRTGTEVKTATWDAERSRWALETSAGTHEADVLVTACGQLTIPRVPPIPGLDDFEGPAFHTARWDHDVDVTNRRVAVVGTGCSAIQVVPAIQPIVAQVDVYQRSPGWTMPKTDFAYRERTKRLFERFPVLQRTDRAATLAFMELGAAAMTKQPWLLRPFRALGRAQINRAIDDPEMRRKVTPADEFGCKRVMLTDDWYPALTRPNVELVVDRIQRITPGGIRTADGVERPADVLVLATGFESHAFTAPMKVVGDAGRTLDEEWADVPRAYLGLTVPSFPNMFLLYGPNTNGGTGSVIYTIEAGMRHVIAGLRALERTGAERIELRRDAAERFDRELREALARSVWHSGCTSWYVDANGNDPSQWPWLWTTYRRRAERVEPDAYELARR